MKKKPNIIVAAFVFTVAILLLGYFSFGIWTSLIFSSGFLGGFLLWLFLPSVSTFEGIRWPYWIAFFLFLLHRVEEKVMDFFDRLAEITGTRKPEILSFSVIALVILSVGAWLLIPLLMKRGYAFGSYLAWTFFAAMGITELAHFVFPFFTDEVYGYFPGMVSVVLLAPVAWWGMYRLSKGQ
ncbi:HXXEE domain-containing protein [Flavobacterium caeni]|uniref:HXXEE domain-containing protein n=1 Tax=Flavobacterium caeni TaxID=490189 RepID=A0A1G5EEC0_9FLAO|nr:HXXEE domain-containing protein [Flavobacterium caeni]SCY25322.1 Protein of unknown function with HXXEE motif-containing protein [Flavobacterium caeni]